LWAGREGRVVGSRGTQIPKDKEMAAGDQAHEHRANKGLKRQRGGNSFEVG